MALETLANMIMIAVFCHFLARCLFLGLDYKFPAKKILPNTFSESTTSSSSQARKENHDILNIAGTITCMYNCAGIKGMSFKRKIMSVIQCKTSLVLI